MSEEDLTGGVSGSRTIRAQIAAHHRGSHTRITSHIADKKTDLTVFPREVTIMPVVCVVDS